MGKLFLMVLLILGSLPVFAGDRISELRSLYALYNQRFDSQGKYRPDERKAEEFILAQDSFAARMKAEGALQEVLLAENSYDGKLWVRLYVFQDESQKILTLYSERGKYQDREVESFLRFRDLASLEKGLNFVPVMDTHAITVKGYYMTPEKGGTLQLVYAVNIRNKKYAAKNLFLVREGARWFLKTEQQQVVTKAWLDIWTQFFPPNGGVRSVDFR